MKKTEDIIKEIGVPIYVRLLNIKYFYFVKQKNMLIINLIVFKITKNKKVLYTSMNKSSTFRLKQKNVIEHKYHSRII